MEIKGKCNKRITKDFSAFTKMGEYKAPFGFVFESYSAINFNMHDENTTFNLGKENAYRDISISYLSGVQTLSWYYLVASVGISPPDTIKTTLKFSHGGSAKWTDDRGTASSSSNTKNPNLLKLQFSLPAKFDIKSKNSTGNNSFWDKNDVDPPEKYKDIQVSLPNIDFNLRALDYFLTTNLILPGAQLFIADEPSGKAGDNYGLFMPRDTILTGKVAKDLVQVQ